MVAICAVLAAVGSGVAFADSHDNGGGNDFLVTVAARSCPSYTDITGNLARNDIQESLRDLGPDTPYVSGEPIDPVKEADNQPNCSPISNWRFTLGTGIGGAIKGTWGSLSFVSQPFSTSVVTQPSTPMRDVHGHTVAGQSIAGATTFELNQDEEQAASHHGLWIQGGTVDDPVLDKLYPGDLRVWRTALRGRQPQRRQRRDGRLSQRLAARVLLCLLRDPAAEQRHADHPQASAQRPERERAVRDGRQHLL